MAMVKNRWKHLKTSDIYEIVGFAIQEATMEPVVIYKRVGERTLWTRPCQEFFDGRFEQTPGSVKTRPGVNLDHLEKAADNIFVEDDAPSDRVDFGGAEGHPSEQVARRDSVAQMPPMRLPDPKKNPGMGTPAYAKPEAAVAEKG